MADFIAVPNGTSATGYLVANGNVYPAVSGHVNKWSIPPGHYTHGGAEALDPAKNKTMYDGKNIKKFRKFRIWGTGPAGSILDQRQKNKQRKYIEFHYDGGSAGTAGCIGYQDPAAKDALIADEDKSVNVSYLESDAEVKAAIEKKLGHKVDWSKVQKPRAPGGGAAAAPHSKTKKGKRVKRGNTSVRAGKKHRHTAHKKAPLVGGGHVADGSSSIFVGREQYQVAGVDHMTTDGSPIANGESTILFT